MIIQRLDPGNISAPKATMLCIAIGALIAACDTESMRADEVVGNRSSPRAPVANTVSPLTVLAAATTTPHSTAVPRRRIANTAATVSTATPTASPTLDTAPIEVAVTLDEAEREVMSWLDPSREPKIGWSRYVRRGELERTVATTRWATVRDKWGGGFEDRFINELTKDYYRVQGESLALVVASTGGIGELSGIRPTTSGQRLQRQAQVAAVFPSRFRILAIFDAQTGERQAALSIDWQDRRDTELEALVATIPTRAVFLRSPSTPIAFEGRHDEDWPSVTEAARSWTATPTPTAVPDHAFLDWSALPPELEPTLRTYSIAPGNSWTWEFTSVNGDVRWTSQIVTETIESAWMEGDRAVVRSIIDAHSLTPGRNRGRNQLVPVSGAALRFITPDMIVGGRQLSDWMRERPALSKIPTLSGLDQGPGVAVNVSIEMLPPVAGESHFGSSGIEQTASSIETEAGVFENCWRSWTSGGASHGSVRWICPGVGMVQYGFGDCAMYHCSAVVATLIRWHHEPLPAR